MKIRIPEGIARDDRGKVKRALKKAFTDAPAIDIGASEEKALRLDVVVENGPKELPARDSVKQNICAVLEGTGYRFASVSFS